jgi:hypothetical protein
LFTKRGKIACDITLPCLYTRQSLGPTVVFWRQRSGGNQSLRRQSSQKFAMANCLPCAFFPFPVANCLPCVVCVFPRGRMFCRVPRWPRSRQTDPLPCPRPSRHTAELLDTAAPCFPVVNIARGRDGSKTVVCKKNPLWYVKKTS